MCLCVVTGTVSSRLSLGKQPEIHDLIVEKLRGAFLFYGNQNFSKGLQI